jgi:hypothetical protein
MGPIGHFSVGLAAKPLAPKVPLAVLLLATWLLDILAIAFGFAGIKRVGDAGLPWSHGLFVSVIWSVLAALLAARIYRDRRAGRSSEFWCSAIGCWTSFLIPSPSPAFLGVRGNGTMDIRQHPISRFFSVAHRKWDSASTTPSARSKPRR